VVLRITGGHLNFCKRVVNGFNTLLFDLHGPLDLLHGPPVKNLCYIVSSRPNLPSSCRGPLVSLGQVRSQLNLCILSHSLLVSNGRKLVLSLQMN
jgi:hypothetical protein